MRVQIISLISLAILAAGCESAGKRTAYGAGIGAAAGAAAGAIIGHQTGNRGKGAAIGAAIGAAAGTGVGYRLDKQAKELEKVAETRRTENGIISKLKSDILFDTGLFQLKPQAITNLAEMAAILKKYPENVITVRGYTDSTGTEKGNQLLSEKRAAAVRDELVKGGVPAPTINAVGEGRNNPVGDNKTAEGRAQNRRVEVEITVDESKVPKK